MSNKTEPSGEWVTEYIYKEHDKFYFRTPFEDLEGPFDTLELVKAALTLFCEELG